MNLEEAIELFKREKINWVEIAPFIEKVYKKEKSVKSIPLDRRISKSIIRAYNFLKENSPKNLSPKLKTNHFVISYLPSILEKIKSQNLQLNSYLVIQKTISGELNKNKLLQLLRDNGFQESFIKNTKEKSKYKKEINILKKYIELFNAIIENPPKDLITEIRNELNKECHNLAIKLEWLADEDFAKQDRKEYVWEIGK